MTPIPRFTACVLLTLITISGGCASPPAALNNNAASRTPSQSLSYQSVSDSPFFVMASSFDRCGDQTVTPLTNVEIDEAVKRVSSVRRKLQEIVSKIRAVNQTNGAIAEDVLQRLRILLDPGDGIICGAQATYVPFQTMETGPSIQISARGTSRSSWETVIPHEFAHLVIKALGFDGGPLREVWADLIAISANEFRPVFAEGDGEKTLARIKQNLDGGQVSAAMKESYRFGCASPLAQRDFKTSRRLDAALETLQIHNVSCIFVRAFLEAFRKNADRQSILYEYLFKKSAPFRPRLSHSTDLAALLNELASKPLHAPPRTLSPDSSSVSLDSRSPEFLAQFHLSPAIRGDATSGAVNPVSVQLETENGTVAFQWTQFIGVFESDARLSKRADCGGAMNCFCVEGTLRARAYFHSRKTNRSVQAPLKGTIRLETGCYDMQLQETR